MNILKASYLPITLPSAVFLIIVIFLAYRAFAVYRSVKTYEVYWQDLAEETEDNEFTLVALGDSTIQAIGATNPRQGVVHQVAELIEAKTNKKVHIINLSKSGGRIKGLVETQLPKLENLNPDLVIVSIGANDAIKGTDISEYKKYYKKMVANLPLHQTIFANTPDVANRKEYQKVFQEIATQNDLNVAKVYENVYPHRNDPRVYAGDFFHPSAKGYSYWYQAFRPEALKLISK